MSRCRHKTKTSMFLIKQPDGRLVVVPIGRCRRCGDSVSLGPSNDRPRQVQLEMRAAALVAGHETANDTDDELNDPVIREVFEAWLGFANMTDRAQAVVDLYEWIVRDLEEP